MLRFIIVAFSFVAFCGLVWVNNGLSVEATDLVAYWSFDKDSGESATDDSGNGYDGEVTDADWEKNGKFGGAMSFDGTGGFVNVNTQPGLDPGKDDWSIELWLKRADQDMDWQKIMTKYPCCNWNGYRIGFHTSNIHVIFGTGPAPDMVEFKSTTQILDEDWHHLAVVFDRDAEATIYFDGVADDTTADITHIGEIMTEQNLEIGRCHWCGGGATMGFNGLLDEVKIWRAALTPADIQLAIAGKLGTAVSPEGALSTKWGSLKEN